MELATALVTHFHPCSNSISLDGNGLDDALDASLAAFTADIEAAVPSYLGIQLTESDDRLEAKIDRLLSEHGIDPAQFDYGEEAGVQAKA